METCFCRIRIVRKIADDSTPIEIRFSVILQKIVRDIADEIVVVNGGG